MVQDLKEKVQEQEEEKAVAEVRTAGRRHRSPVQAQVKAGKQAQDAARARDREWVRAGNSNK